MRARALQLEFVDSMPDCLDEGVLYISIPFRTSMHLCACGCRNRVVMPIRPGAWSFTYDGETASMSPSVGNWTFPCRSHYWIECNAISWAAKWDDKQIARARRPTATRPDQPEVEDPAAAPTEATLRRRMWRLLRAFGRCGS